ncbi:MAG: hypothetical protein LBH75_01620 [Treponema sp.]|jgi:hypothetical protein|nr:hypothetical protein [Treponema sp.]
MKNAKFTYSYIGLAVLAVLAGCNVFSADAGAYRENNPQGFHKVRLGRNDLARLSFGTSSRYAEGYVGDGSNAGSLHDPGCIIDVSDFDAYGNGTITMTSSNSSNNAGKIAGSEDGIAYYYKKVPRNTNFRLSADFEVLIFGLSNGKADLNGQEGWGIMARDYVPQYTHEPKPNLDGELPPPHPGGIDMTYDAMREGQPSSDTNLDAHPDGRNFVYWAGHKLPDGPGGSGNMIMVGGVKRGVRVYYRYGVTDPIRDAMTNPNTVTDASHAKFNYLPREMDDYSLYPHIRARPDYPWGTHIISQGGEEPTGLPLLKYSLSLEKTNNGFKASFDAPDGIYSTPWGEITKGVLANNSPAQGAKVEYSDIDTKTRKAKELGGRFIRDLLFKVDDKYYYVGFFVCRDAKVRISNIQYYEADVENCARKIEDEDIEPDIITPTFNILSPSASSTTDYTFGAKSNVRGVMDLSLNGEHIKSRKGEWTVEPTNASAVPFERFEIPELKLKEGQNVFTAVFTPLADTRDVDPDNPDDEIEQLDDAYPVEPAGSYQVLNRSPIKKTFVVEYRQITGATPPTGHEYATTSLYAAPTGRSFNKGTKDSPLDLITAINFVQPGQEVILLGGIYSYKHVEIPLYNSGEPVPGHENNGWEEKDGNVDTSEGLDRMAVMTRTYQKYKYLIAEDPVNNPPILDFQCPETLKMDRPDIKGFEIRGDYWWIEGVHVRNTSNKRVGLNIFGKNNVLHNVKAYWNGDSGISIAGSSAEPKALWPAYNTVQFCESFANMDKSREDADGFADKLTAWVGNRFLYCTAHHNADDGWDLFSKKETGGIGAVFMYKSVAYMNGRWLQPGADDDPNQADLENFPYWHLQNESTMSGGNGFKMGGEGIPVLHESLDCLSFLNDADGFTTNSDPAIIVSYATAYNNGKTVDPGAIRKPSNFTIYGTGTSTNIGLDARLTQVVSLYALDAPDVAGSSYNTDESSGGYKGDRFEFPRHGDYAEAKSTATGYLWYAATADENGWDGRFSLGGSFNLSGRKLTTIDNVENAIPPFSDWDKEWEKTDKISRTGDTYSGDREETANALRGGSTWFFYDNDGRYGSFKGAFLEFDVAAANAMAAKDEPSTESCAYYKLNDFMKLKDITGSTPGARDLW